MTTPLPQLPHSRSLLHRRDVLGLAALGMFGPIAWSKATNSAEKPLPRAKSAILLWMDGGPSQHDTFDPKPEAPEIIRGEFGVIDTGLPGVQFCERFPQLSRMTKHLAILRGMSTQEDDHGRARIYMHTGYRQGQAGLTYPGLGSIASAQLGQPGFPLPNFVTIGSPAPKYDILAEPGYLGLQHGALILQDPNRSLENLQAATAARDVQRRQQALSEIDAEFARRYRSPTIEAHRTVVEQSVRLMKTEMIKAFDLNLEPPAVRDRYGDHTFGRSCLLARRLIEAGCPLVEVYAADWDSHETRRAKIAADLMLPVDHGTATLINDLAERGMLDQTLIIWMGEFGRTPEMNKIGGRDHFPDAWTTLLAGGGIVGGQVIGRTDKTGDKVVERPISGPDFLATICRALGIDHTRKVNAPNGQPVSIVDAGAQPIKQLF